MIEDSVIVMDFLLGILNATTSWNIPVRFADGAIFLDIDSAIPVDILQSEVEDCDVLVIGPQIAHKLDYIKPIIEPYHIPYVIVDQEVYGKMDGATVMKQVLIARRKADMAK